MDTERSGLDEAMDVGSSTISHLKSLKTAATFSKAGYGAALGGPFSAAIGAVIANRNQFAKILLVILAILLLPVLFIVMLPGLIFGSLTDQSDVLNSNSMISENIRASREAIVEVLEESHEDILAEIHAAISRLPQGVYHNRGRMRYPNCVRQLNFTFFLPDLQPQYSSQHNEQHKMQNDLLSYSLFQKKPRRHAVPYHHRYLQ